MRALILCALLAAPFGLASVPASSSSTDDGWLSVRLALDGSGAHAWLNATGTGPDHQLGVFLYQADQTFAGGFGFGVFRGTAGAIVQVDASALGGPTLVVEQTAYSEPAAFMGTGFDINGAGEVYLLLMSAGGGAWNFDLVGGAARLASDAGPDAFLLTQDDFELGQGAHVDALGPGARADVAREHRLAVRDTLVAIYGPGAVPSTQVPPLAVGANAMTIDTPQGMRTCELGCDFALFVGEGPRRGVAGDYAFRLTGAGAGLAEDVTLWGADARLPAG